MLGLILLIFSFKDASGATSSVDKNLTPIEDKLLLEEVIDVYNNNYASSVDILLGGECPFVDEVKREFTYDDNGNLVNVHSVLDGDAKNGYTTMKVEKFYTNELEEF